MKNRIILAIAAVLILAVGLTAETGHNLEDTYCIPLTAYTTQFISLPYNNSFTNAHSLLIGIQTGCGCSGVSVYNWTGTAWQRYAGGAIGAINFPIVPGTGYMVMSPGSVPCWYVEGSHNPAVSISLTANVKKIVSIPFTSPSTTAALLRNEIVAAGGTGVSVYDYDGATGQYKKWCGGGIGQVDFAVTPGTAYVVKSTSDVAAWFPAYQ
ncbi:MAG TPA: hypothetical protein PKJ37_07720 [Acidobacteriota bacterium]|nr:hypothetical protein [Acidobacteriota bacterium]HNT17761.1 hypothetical protein [Acidobacteriota bacterium]